MICGGIIDGELPRAIRGLSEDEIEVCGRLDVDLEEA